jgi:hypothetical protein
MLLISIQPFAVKKLVVLGITLICLSATGCFADCVFLAARYAAVKPARAPSAEVRAAMHEVATPRTPATGLIGSSANSLDFQSPSWNEASPVSIAVPVSLSLGAQVHEFLGWAEPTNSAL